MQRGPVPQEELVQKITAGDVLATDLVWREGMSDWQPLSQVAELSVAAPLAPPSMAVSTPAPPTYAAPQFPTEKVDSFLWQSIVATLMCCMPFGVVAIVYATKVDGLLLRGDIEGAKAASKSAKLWVGVSVGSWLLLVVPYILFIIFVTASSEMQ